MPRIVQLLVGADQHHYVWSDNLRELGIGELPPAQYIDLGAIAGLRYHIDMPAQRLDLDADAAHLQRPLQQFSGEVDRYQAASTINGALRSEEHTSELQSLMRISYAVFCLKKKTNTVKSNTQSVSDI